MGRTGSTLLLVTMLALGCDDKKPPAPPPTSRPAATTTTTTAPATTRAVEVPRPLVELLDTLRRDDPDYPTTQPLAETIEMPAAARIVFTTPVFLCTRGDLWITRPDAPPTPEALKLAPTHQTHVVRDTVRFVFWRPGTTPWTPELIADDVAPTTSPVATPQGVGTVWIAGDRRLPLDPTLDRDWPRARPWNTDAIQAAIVPTSTGVSVIQLVNGKLDERHVALLDAPASGASTQFVLDTRGLLAWSIDPNKDSKVARFVDGKWAMLTPDAAWPASLVHVLPFQDGSVLTIADDDGKLALHSTPVETLPVDEARVRALVAQLADKLPEDREAAQAALAAIGPAAWPLLEKLADAQRPEARIRIRAILGDETTPTLGGVTPQPGPSSLIARLNDGGVVLYFSGGASAVDASGNVQTAAPSWLAVRPSGPVRALSRSLTAKLDPRHVNLCAWNDEWIVEHDVDGPLRWMGNHFETLTKPGERPFKRFVGIDSMGRWVFKTNDASGPTLVVDVTLPDPRPHFPVWTITKGKTAGWTDDDWPVIKSGGAWVIKDGEWAALKDDAAMHVDATTRPAALLTDAAGNVYSDGLNGLTVRRPDGTTLAWPLPPEATGAGVIDGAAVLIEADDRLFLCNAPGRVIRLRPQFDKAEPFKIEGTFSRGVPATDVRRIWRDPAGRIVFASEGSKLAIAFPSGRISGETSNMIPANALREALRGEDEPAGR